MTSQFLILLFVITDGARKGGGDLFIHSWVAGMRDSNTSGFSMFFLKMLKRFWAACTCASKLSQVLLRASSSDV